MSGRLRVVPGVVVEELGGDLMVMVPGSPEVLTLSGESARVLRQVQAGEAVASHDAVSELIDRGVLQATKLSRRGLIKAGAVGAGAGIAVMAMPGVAAASSVTFTIFSRMNGPLPQLLIPVSQATFSSNAYLSSTILRGPTVTQTGTVDIVGSGTFWLFNNFIGGAPSNLSELSGPWIILDGALNAQLPLSGPITATPLETAG